METYDGNVSPTALPGTAREGTASSRAVSRDSAVTARLRALPSRAVLHRRPVQIAVLLLVVFAFLGAGDENARFSALGHKLMCVCSCNQVLLECNHVGCSLPEPHARGACRRAGSRRGQR